MIELSNKVAIVSGGASGIGRGISEVLSTHGASVAVVDIDREGAESVASNLMGNGQALGVFVDVTEQASVQTMVSAVLQRYGKVDILVNNASAISLTGTLETPMKRFDLMFGINVRGTFATSQACIPHLLKSKNPHILNIASPLNMNPIWFAGSTAYTMAKYGMSMCVLGMAEEFLKQGLGVNALWPKTIINTAALRLVPGVDPETGRTPEIMADAAHAILIKDSNVCTGNFFIDEEVLAADGVTDFSKYRVNSQKPLASDIFLD